MSSDQPTPASTAPAAWYPANDGTGRQRWWDGTQWTEHYSQPYTPERLDLRAPEGTKIWTPWIWLVLFLPLLSWASVFTINFNFSGMVDASLNQNPSELMHAETSFISPGYIAFSFGGWIIYGLDVLFSYLDHRQLAKNGVPRPFHWAWSFLSSAVYTIGRGVVTRRRTGQGFQVVIIQIVLLVVGTVIGFVWAGFLVAQIIGATETGLGTYHP